MVRRSFLLPLALALMASSADGALVGIAGSRAGDGLLEDADALFPERFPGVIQVQPFSAGSDNA